MTRATIFGAATALLLAGSASAQMGPGGTGVPGTSNPYVRPEEMGAHDNMSPIDQMRIRTQEAEAEHNAALARSKGGRAVPAGVSDIIAQAAVNDTTGQAVGTIESVDADGAVIATAAGKVKVPLNAFGKNKQGLLIGMTKKDFEALVAKANATPAG